MLSPRTLLLALVPFAIAAASHALARDGQSDFDAALRQARKSLDAQRAKEAKSQLAAALDAHKDQTYVRERLADVRALTADCAFALNNPRRTVDDVFCGKVESYDAKTGKISLRWEKPKDGKAEGAQAGYPCDDFEAAESGALQLRLPFDGPHTLEVSGKAVGQKVPVFQVCVEGERYYQARLDAGSLHVIARGEGGKLEALESSSDIYNVGRPYKFEIAVRAAQIEAKHNGARLVAADKVKGEYGRAGFRDVLDPQVIAVQGQASKAWIEAEIARLGAADRAAFDARYDVNRDLPEWLRGP